MLGETELLRQYVDEGSQDAFRELVGHTLKLVYGAALRRTDGDGQLALDISQKVFIALAKNAKPLSRHPTLTAWLYTATRNESIKAVLSEQRRKKREHTVAIMNAPESPRGSPIEWQDIRLILDGAMDALAAADREAVLLRFFDEKSFAEIAAALRTTDEAARKRVDRAVDKLRALFAKRGITCSAAALASVLANQPALAGHASLAATVSGSALAGVAASSSLGAAGTAITYMSPAKAGIAIVGLVLALGAVNFVTSVKANAMLQDARATAAEQIAALRTARTTNRNLREALNAASTPKPLVSSDAARMAEMADLIRSGFLGVTSWPMQPQSPGQPDTLTAAAADLAGIIGLNAAQTAALQEVLRTGQARFRAAIAADATVERRENVVTVTVSDAGIVAARDTYEALLQDIDHAIGPDKSALLRQSGFLTAVHSSLGVLGIRSTAMTITKADRVINGRAVGGYTYNGKYSGEHDRLLIHGASNGTLVVSGDRAGLGRTMGDLMSRLPADF